MTVSSLTNRINYVSTGTVGPYSYPFRLQAATDLLVVTRDLAGNETTLVLTTDYVVSGVGSRNGGSVTLQTALTTGWTLALIRDPSLTQLTNLRNQGRYLPSDVEDAFDHLMMIAQAQQGQMDRTLQLGPSVDPATVSTVIPGPTANEAIFWNAAANALETRALSSIGSVALPGQGRVDGNLTAYLANTAEFNVHSFGALGNGVADDTAAFVLALAQCAANSGRYVRASGLNYKLTSTITMPAGVELRCDPGTILTFAVNNQPAFLMSSIDGSSITGATITGTFARAVRLVSCTNISLFRNIVSGGTVVGTDGTLGGFQIHACSDVEVAFNRFSGNGLTNSPGSDIAINGLGIGLSQRIRIHHNRLSSTACQFNILGFDCAYTDIHHNYVSGATGTASFNNGYGIALYRTTALALGLMGNNSVSNNWIANTTGSGIYLQSSLRSIAEENHLWDVCTVADDSTLPNSGIALNGSMGTTVRGNNILRSGMAGINISLSELTGVGTVTAVAGVTTFSLTQAGAYTSAALADRDVLTVGGVPYPVAAFNGTNGCVLIGDPTFGASAFTWTPSGDITCDGNEVEDCPVRYAVKLNGPCTNVTITDNDAKNCYGGFGNVTAAYACFGIAITNNRVNGTTTNFGILGLNCWHSRFDENTLTATALHGIDIAGGGDGNTINGNVVRDAGQAVANTYDAIVVTTTASMVEGNVVRNSGGTTGSRYGLNISGAGTKVGVNVSTGHLTANRLIAQSASGVEFAQSITLEGNATAGVQVQLGTSAAFGSTGVTYSKAEAFLANNATQALTSVDLWTQSNAAAASHLFVQRLNGDFEFYEAPAATAAAAFATFWGTPKAALGGATFNGLKINGTKVVGVQQTGFATQTAVAAKTDLGAAPTNAQIAAWASAVDVAMKAHGLWTT